MNLKKLFDAQNVLMERIEKEHPKHPDENRTGKRILALYVEVGECANEVRCFKFWSHKPASPANVVLEEYVDGWHFVIELALLIGWDQKELVFPDYKYSPTAAFLDVFHSITLLDEYRNHDAIDDLIESYINLGDALGFTWEEIEKAYFEKNKINHIRQDNSY